MFQPEIIFRGDNIVSVLSLVWDWVFQLRVLQSHCLCLIYLCYMVVFRQIDQRPLWVRAVQNTCRTGWHRKSTWSGLCGECLLWLFVHVIHLVAFFFPLLLILGYTYNWYSLLLICHDWAGMLTYFSDKFNRKGSKKILDNRAKVGKELGRET